MTTWSDGTSTNRTAAALEALTPNGFNAADIDAECLAWDDPMGIGYAANFHPGLAMGNQSAFTANRASFMRCVSGGRVAVLRYQVFTQSGNICFAIYDNTGSGAAARPNNRLWTSGSFACPAQGAATVAVSPTVLMKARQHWFAFAADNTTVSLYCTLTAQQIMAVAEGWGGFKDSAFPLPDPAGSITNGPFRCPNISGRRS